jgi:hypothetical protein
MEATMNHDAGDRLLFWVSDKTGVSIDVLYGSALFRLVMILARRASSMRDRSPL